jgi:hypothetical protein
MDDDFEDLEADFSAAGKWIGIAVLLLVALAWATAALSAPRMRNAEECQVAADMAIVARALAAEDIERVKAETIMRRIYDLEQLPDGESLARAILAAAYLDRDAPGGFATRLYVTCMATGGDMDRVLGTGF